MEGKLECLPQSLDPSTSLILQDMQRAGISTDSSGPVHFHRFVDLPAEVRQMIFKACLPHRVFVFGYHQADVSMKNTDLVDWSERPTALPQIALVCKEAYEISRLYERKYHLDLTLSIFQLEERSDPRHFYGTRKIRFNLELDTVIINYSGKIPGVVEDEEDTEHDAYLKSLPNGPFALALTPKANAVLDMGILADYRETTASGIMGNPYREILLQRESCDVILAMTKIYLSASDIRESGLFGLFGEERHVLIDIADRSKIDQYETFIRQRQAGGSPCGDYLRASFPEPGQQSEPENFIHWGCNRYGTQGRVTVWESTNGKDAAGPPAEFTVAGKDATEAVRLIKQSWLEGNHCFDPDDSPPVPWTGDKHYRDWDDEHPVAKFWLSKLPKFSFVVMYSVGEA